MCTIYNILIRHPWPMISSGYFFGNVDIKPSNMGGDDNSIE